MNGQLQHDLNIVVLSELRRSHIRFSQRKRDRPEGMCQLQYHRRNETHQQTPS